MAEVILEDFVKLEKCELRHPAVVVGLDALRRRDCSTKFL